MIGATLQIWNASFVEIVWTIIGLVGFRYNLKNLRSSEKSIEAVEKMNGNNIARHRELSIIAYGHYRNEMFRMATTCVILFVGIFSMLLKNTTNGVTVTGIVVTVGLFIIELLIVMPGILDRRQRRMLLADDRANVTAGEGN